MGGPLSSGVYTSKNSPIRGLGPPGGELFSPRSEATAGLVPTRVLGVGDFRGEFRVTGHAGKRSPERDLRIGMFRGRPASLLLLFVRF